MWKSESTKKGHLSVFSLGSGFEPLEKNTLNGASCRISHVADYFQNHNHATNSLGLVVLGFEIIGAVEPFYELIHRSQVAVIEIAAKHHIIFVSLFSQAYKSYVEMHQLKF